MTFAGYIEEFAVAGIWSIATCLLFTGTWRVGRRMFPQENAVIQLVTSLVLGWASTILVAFALSLPGGLHGYAYLAGIGILGVAFQTVPSRTIHLTELAPASDSNTWHRRFAAVIWAMIAVWYTAHVLTNGLLKYPSDWDSLEYHFPMVDHWLQAGSLYVPEGSRRCCNPGNNEILALWLVAPFSGDFLIHLNNLLPTLLVAAACYELGRELLPTTQLAHVFGLASIGNFVVWRQLINGQNDVGVAACFMSGLLFVIRDANYRAGRNAVLAGICIGILAGIKYFALGYALLLGVTWLFLLTIRSKRRAHLRIYLGIGGVLAFASYWYCRNNIMYGSPVYPRDLFNQPDLFSKLCPGSETSAMLTNKTEGLVPLYVTAVVQMMGPLHWAALLVLPGSIAVLTIGAIKEIASGRTPKAAQWLALGALAVGSGLVFGVTPMAVENQPGTLNQLKAYYCPVRYSLSFLNITLLVFLLAVDVVVSGITAAFLKPHGPGKYARVILLVGYLSLWIAAIFGYAGAAYKYYVQEGTMTRSGLVPIGLGDLFVTITTALCLGVFIVNTLLLQVIVTRFNIGQRILTGLFVFVVSISLPFLAQSWHRGFDRFYESRFCVGLTHLATQDSQTITCALTSRYYPLFGSRRQHVLCKPHYIDSATSLVDYLREHNAECIATVIARRSGNTVTATVHRPLNELMALAPAAVRMEAESAAHALYSYKEALVPSPIAIKTKQPFGITEGNAERDERPLPAD